AAEEPPPADRVDDDRTVITAQDRVLVVACDSAAVARTAVDAGRVNGLRVVVETQPDAALRRIQQLTPAAGVVSATLPPVAGQPLVVSVRGSAELRHLPVLAVLPPGAQQATREALLAGAYDAVLCRPDGSGTVVVAEAVARLAAFTGRKVRRLLLLGQAQLPDWPDVAVLRAGGLAEALSILSESDVDAVAAVAADPGLEVTGRLAWLRG